MATVKRTWPVLLLAAPAFVAIWSGWVGLGTMTGFGVIHPLPGTPLDGWQLDTRLTPPLAVEAYAAYALWVWLSSDANGTAKRFAQVSAIASLVLGAAGQIAYHLMAAAEITEAPWQITTLVACLPVVVLGMGTALAHLCIRRADVQDGAQERAQEPALVRWAGSLRAAVDAVNSKPQAPALESVRQVQAELGATLEESRTSPAPTVTTAGTATPSSAVSPPAAAPGNSSSSAGAGAGRKRGTSGRSGGGRAEPSEDLLAAFKDVVKDLRHRHLTVNYKNVAPGLRDRGHPAGRAKVDALIAEHAQPQLQAV